MIVTLSGIDGSGKSTRCAELCMELQKLGVPAEPSRPRYAANESIKDFCEVQFGDRFGYFRNVDADFYIACLTADWLAYAVKTLDRAQERVLVCDRYIYDVLAQAIHMRAEAKELRKWIGRFPVPAVSFLLQIQPKRAHERLLARVSPAIHEAEGLQELVALDAAYDQVKEELGWQPYVVGEELSTYAMAELVRGRWARIEPHGSAQRAG